MNTKFKLINGNIFSIPLEQDMTIEEVKDIIRNQKGYDDGEIVLIFKANKLRDYQILRKLRYKPEDTIFIHKKKSKREKQQIPLQYRAKIPQYGRNDNQYRQQIPPQNNKSPFRRNENIPSEEDIQNVIEYTGVDRSLAKAALIRYDLAPNVAINHILDGSFNINEIINNNDNNNYYNQIPPHNNQTHFRRNENIPSEEDIQNVIEYTGVERSLAEAALMRYNLNIEFSINHILNNDIDDVMINNNNNNNNNNNDNYNDNY